MRIKAQVANIEKVKDVVLILPVVLCIIMNIFLISSRQRTTFILFLR